MAAILFSIGGLCIKVVPWSPLAINGARNLISVIIIGIYLKVIHHKIIVNPPVIFGAVCMTGVTSFYCIANKLTTAIEPVLNPILVAVFYHEMISPLSFVGAVIVVVSVVIYNVWKAKA